MTCGRCGDALDPDARFCIMCGARADGGELGDGRRRDAPSMPPTRLGRQELAVPSRRATSGIVAAGGGVGAVVLPGGIGPRAGPIGPWINVAEPPEPTVSLRRPVLRRRFVGGAPAEAAPPRRYGRPHLGSRSGLRLAVVASLIVVSVFALGLYVCVAWVVAPLERVAARQQAVARQMAVASEPVPRPPLRSFRTTHYVRVARPRAAAALLLDASSEARRIATAGSGDFLSLRDFRSLQEVRPGVSRDGLAARTVNGLAFRRDGVLLAVAVDGRRPVVGVWDLASGRLRGKELFPERVTALRFRSDGTLQVVSGRFVYLWNVVAGRLLGRWPFVAEGASAGESAITPDGRFLTRQEGPVVEVWNLEQRRLSARVALADGARVMALRGDGSYLVTAEGSDVTLWAVSPLRRIRRLRGHSSPPRAAAISQDGLMLISTAPDEVLLWDLATGEVASRQEFRGGQRFDSVAFCADGTVAALAPTQLRVWGVW